MNAEQTFVTIFVVFVVLDKNGIQFSTIAQHQKVSPSNSYHSVKE